MSKDITSIGAPGQGDVAGSVTSYLDIGGWIQNDVINGSQPGQLFGYSVDVQDDYMVAGAPGTFAEGSDFAAVGAAYFFELDRQSSQWTQLGSTIRGGTDIDSFSEMFGASVATSGRGLVVAVGAPKRASGNGGVYTFRYQAGRADGASEWLNMTSSPLSIEKNPDGGQFGTTVAISSDGSRIVAGAPGWAGGQGYVVTYEWDETSSTWDAIFETAGESSGDQFGSSVTFLDTETIAIGSPGSSTGRGTVRVYQQRQGDFEQLGDGIEGTEAGDSLGAFGTISGRVRNDGGVSIMVASANGVVDRYEYDGTEYTKPFTTVSDLGGPVTSLGMAGRGDDFVVGVSSINSASFYSSDRALGTPTVAPSLAGTSPGATDVPTMAPSANTSLEVWQLKAYFTGDSRLGSSVAIAADTVASGDRVSGMVMTFLSAGEEWTPTDNLTISGTGSGFGESVALNAGASVLAVGAPGMFAAGSTAVTTGAVYVYSGNSGSWVQGAEIRGAEGIYSAGEAFGSSIDISSDGSIIVSGAPFNGEEGITNRGRVYTFQGESSSFTDIDETPLLGSSSGDYFGSAVAISGDGSTLFIGAPGGASGDGYVAVYSFDGSSWGSPVTTLLGSTSGELLGTSIAALASDGSIFAAGAPSYNGGVGAVRVFERQGDGTYVPLGDPIEDTSGAVVGGVESISGSVENGVPTVLVAASGGVISTYQYASGAWVAAVEPILTGLKGTPVLRGSTTLGSFVAGSRNEIVVYSLSQ